jgi:hypothetical protein
VTVTPLTALTPASAAGKLVDGVMITPLDIAPYGTTLEIRRPSVPRNASVVAFGGADASGGAFALPVLASPDVKIALAEFGGYAITTPATGKAADVKAPVAPCSKPAAAADAPAHAAAAGSRPLMSCISIAEKLDSLRKTAKAAFDSGNIAILNVIFAASSALIGGEMARILSAPPNESDDIELRYLLAWALGNDRQVQLSGLDERLVAATGTTELARALTYHTKLIQQVCSGAQGQQPTAVYLDYYRDAFGDLRQEQLTGAAGPGVELLQMCLEKVKFQVTGSIDASEDVNGGWTDHVVANVTSTIAGQGAGSLVSDRAKLTFTTMTAQADPSFAATGGSAMMTKAQGTFEPDNAGAWVTRQIRCDKNRKFVIDRKAYADINANGLWNDTEGVTIAMNGFSFPGTPASVASASWQQTVTSAATRRVTMQLDVDTVERTYNGPCNGIAECATVSLESKLKGSQLSD